MVILLARFCGLLSINEDEILNTNEYSAHVSLNNSSESIYIKNWPKFIQRHCGLAV